jgi:hypothetical protein
MLCSLIFVEYGNNKELYTKYVLEDNISFVRFRNYYEKYFMGVESNISNNDVLVNNVSDYEYVDGMYKYYKEDVNVISSGIVVYVGDKDNLGNTVIIQGVDGIDIWYSNLGEVSIGMYDYVSNGDKIGLSNEYYLVSLYKDGNMISYEEYS